MLNKKVSTLFVCLLLLFLTGCWDQIQIEDRGFVIASAIDLGEQGSDGTYQLSETNQFVVPMAYGSPSGGSGSGEQKAFTNITATGTSIYTIDREMGTTTNKIPFFGHLKIIVFSMELAKTPHLLDNLMDIYIRDIEMRRGIKVLVSDGEAKKILTLSPPNEKLPAMYINDLLEHSAKSTGTYNPIVVGDIHEHLINQTSFTIPLVAPGDNRMLSHGGAVFKGVDHKVVGVLDREEMRGLNIVSAKYNGELIEIQSHDKPLIFEVKDLNSNININTKNKKKLDVTITIHTEGRVAEILGREEIKTAKELKTIENKIKEKIEELTMKTIERAQKKMNADIFGIKNVLRQKHYELWKEMKDDWEKGENHFANCDIHVDAKVRIRQPGNAQ